MWKKKIDNFKGVFLQIIIGYEKQTQVKTVLRYIKLPEAEATKLVTLFPAIITLVDHSFILGLS